MTYRTLSTRALAYLLSASTALSPLHGYSAGTPDPEDFVGSSGREGQVFGQGLTSDLVNSPAKIEDGQISMPSSDGEGSVQYGESFSVMELYPGTNPANSGSANEYFPDGSSQEVDTLQGIYESENDMEELGGSRKSSLWADANKENPSVEGAAYKVLLDTSEASKPDFTNDPMLALTKETYDNLDVIAEGFGECTSEDVFKNVSFEAHNPEYETCDRITKPVGGCVMRNNITTSGETVDVFVGSKGREWVTITFDLVNGTWRKVSPSDGDYVRAQIPKVDYGAVCDDPEASYTQFVAAWDWTGHGIPGPVDSTVWYRSLQHPTCDNGLKGKIQIQDTKGGGDTDWVLGGKFRYQVRKLEGSKWTTDQCIQDAQKVGDSFCEGGLTVTKGAKTDNECTTVNGVRICPNGPFGKAIGDAPVAGIPKLATEVEVSFDCSSFNEGPMQCYTDINGEEQCPYNEGNIQNTCQELENNPACGFISSTCVNGAEGESGECYVTEETWDCGSSVNIDTIEKSTEFQCNGAIRCMGDDCIDPTKTKNQSANFAKASALLNAAQFMTQDMDCSEGATSEGGDENVDEGCTAFVGEAGECKIAVGGVQDCCEKPSNVGMGEYLSMLMAVPKLDGAIDGLSDGNIVKSAYTSMKAPVMDTWSSVTKPFTNHMDNISGTVSDFFSPLEQAKDQLIGALDEQLSSVMTDVMGSVAQDAGTQAAAAGTAAAAEEGAKEALVSQPASAMLNTMMTVYTAYTVAVAIIQMIWACEEDEFKMNAQRAVESCTYVGSYCKTEVLGACIEKRKAYCCFNSPLSRIVQEQTRGQLGMDFGSPEDPVCSGLPLERLSEIDWDKVDLSEWLAIMKQNGQFPSQSDLNIEALTGGGSTFQIEGERANATERTLDRLEGIDVDEARRDAQDSISIDTGAP